MLTVGATLAAFALEEFLVPNNIFDGGVTGVSMILMNYLPVKLGVLVAIINIPFLIVGWKRMGHGFIISAIYSLALFSVMTGVFEPMVNATRDTLLAVVFGGIFLGAGVGLVLRGGGVLDGTEIVAVLVSRKTSLSVGQVVLIFNVVIYTVAGVLFGLDRGMYSLIMYFITSKIIDIVEVGPGESTKSVMIITDDGQTIAEKILNDLGRTVTFIQGKGFVSQDSKDVLYVVVTRAEIKALKDIIDTVEGSTFTTISEVSEIVGTHTKVVKEAPEIIDNPLGNDTDRPVWPAQ